MGGVHLVGTHHLDIIGAHRVRKFLEHLRPRHVAVEADKEYARCYDALDLEQEILRYKSMYPRADPDLIKVYCATRGYEYLAAKQYCKEHRVPLHLIDQLPAEESASMETVRSEEEDYMKMTLEQFITFPRYVAGTVSEEMLRETEERDAKMQKRIRKLKDVVVLVGFSHIIGRYQNLYLKLEDMNPKPWLLCQADGL